ncbi:glycoside hydrolase [candidate division LCP-89 bacterium B3_LCP]|uniref:Glycoside hydrolase n=1 Tax=candidate division LCP-89 bacterium B3_LCP TaxID=2012998 RepID=A0A532UUF5_UNCL8|nr:MAG: glycoside hydrolase [candidate division LCP-89 bacterium B3_LCP]
MESIGSFSLVLHSHLPYVISHGKWPHGMDWLNEAAAETYLPLLRIFDQLVHEGHSPKVTIGLSPVLCEQLTDDVFKADFKEYLNMKVEAARLDQSSFQKAGEQEMAQLAENWEKFYEHIAQDYKDKYDEDILSGFKRLQDDGHIEIITCAATHGYLPLLGEDECINAQVKIAVENYLKHFGRKPNGIWLPESAYRPCRQWSSPINGEDSRLRVGIEEFLHMHDLRYFYVDSHMIEGGKALGIYLERFEALKKYHDEFAKGYTKISDEFKRTPYQSYMVRSRDEFDGRIHAFIRDPKTGLQVWSGEHGYPGDGEYLDFHKKHFPGGHRYWRVTSAKADLGDKELYNPQLVQKRIDENAGHFKEVVRQVLLNEGKDADGLPLICAPFDTELFGHWWFEGPRWMYQALKWIAQDQEINLVTGSEYLDQVESSHIVSLPEGSWGEGGHHHIWFNEDTSWSWELIYEAEKKMIDAVDKWIDHPGKRVQDLLAQLARELLLLESSDWQFLISTFSARDYAETRLVRHHLDFDMLYKMLEKLTSGGEPDEEEWVNFLAVRDRDTLFSEIKPEYWASLE